MVQVSLQQLACEAGLQKRVNDMSPQTLIRAIQKQRGEEPCYLTDKRYTCKSECEWRANCRKLRAEWLR